MRINTSSPRGGPRPGGWNPSIGPDPNMIININNGGGPHRAIDIIDDGFLELVRMGVKGPNDPTVLSSLAAYDHVIGEKVGAGADLAWFRSKFRRLWTNQRRRSVPGWRPRPRPSMADLRRGAWEL